MRLKYVLKIWLIVFSVGFVGLFIFSLLIHNPSSVEIAAYGEVPPPWYYELFSMIWRLLPILLIISAPFFALGFILYRSSDSELQQEAQPKTYGVALFTKKTMIPAYVTTAITYVSLYLFASKSDTSEMGALVVVAMIMLFLAIFVPINIVVWIICMKRSRIS